jgi:hypothetical protein
MKSNKLIIALTVTVLCNIQQSYASARTVNTLVTCVSDDSSRGSVAVYKNKDGKTFGVTSEESEYRESGIFTRFHDEVTLINDRSGIGRSGVYLSKYGIFQLNLMKDGRCHLTIMKPGSDYPEFGLMGRAHFNSQITYDDN